MKARPVTVLCLEFEVLWYASTPSAIARSRTRSLRETVPDRTGTKPSCSQRRRMRLTEKRVVPVYSAKITTGEGQVDADTVAFRLADLIG